MKKLFSLLTLLLACAGIYAQPWQVSTTAGPHETQVFAKLSTNLEAPATGSFVIGAFIGDECRATASQYTDVTGAPVSTSSGAPLYVLTVKGNYNSTTDKDQPITFKLWNPSTGFEYPLTLNEAVIFDTQLHGDPISEPTITMSLNAAATYTLTLKEVEVDQNYTLSDYITVTPDGATLPENLKWELSIDNGGTTWEDPSPYASIYTENGVTKLKGVKPYAGITLHMKREGEATDLANTTFDVVQHATAIIILKPTFEVYRPKSPTENGPMIAFMQAGTSYKLDPETSSDVVKWEKTDPESILQEDGTFYLPVKGGTAQIRPYIERATGNLYPTGDAWIAVTVKVPVESFKIDYTVFEGTFKANVGDTHIYERMAKMITVEPAEATDKTYTVSVDATGPVTLANETSITATQAGSGIITITANNSDPTSSAPVEARVNIEVVKPIKQATITTDPIYIQWSDTGDQDITADISQNVKFDTEGTLDPSSTVALSGSSVSCTTTPTITTAGIGGTFLAVAEGTTTFTVTVRWPDYDTWGLENATLQYLTAQSPFDVIVQKYVALQYFTATVTNAVARQSGTITLTPYPANATFDPSKIGVTIENGFTGDWGAQLTTSKNSSTQAALIFNYSSNIPGMIYVRTDLQEENLAGTGGTTITPIPINDATTTVYKFEVGYPLSLAAGWQWRSNPYGAILPTDFNTVFANVTEVRTSNAFLYNDPSWNLFGTLQNSTEGIKQGETYKINMKSADESVLNAGGFNDASLVVTLQPGWNWVGSPYLFNRSINDVFADLVAQMPGAVVVGKTGSAELSSSNSWEGSLQVINAGEGLIIKNPNSAAVNFTFKNEFTDFQPVNYTNNGVKGESTNHVWEYDHTRFMNNMTMVAKLVDIEHPEQYSIGAFVGDECRGEGIIENGKAFITVHCDAGEYVTFKLYSPYTNEFYPIEEGLQAQTRVGSLKAPFRMHANYVVDGINNIAGSNANTESYDLSGRRVGNQQRGISIRRNADGSLHKVINK